MTWELIAAAAWKIAAPLFKRAGRALRDQWAEELKTADTKKEPPHDKSSTNRSVHIKLQ